MKVLLLLLILIEVYFYITIPSLKLYLNHLRTLHETNITEFKENLPITLIHLIAILFRVGMNWGIMIGGFFYPILIFPAIITFTLRVVEPRYEQLKTLIFLIKLTIYFYLIYYLTWL